MRSPFTMVASDAGIVEFGTGVPHPRAYGTFTRSLGVYVREKQVLTLEDAIRKMTSLPAQTFRLHERGALREGYWADIVIFDPARIADMATFSEAASVRARRFGRDRQRTGCRRCRQAYWS